MKNGSMSYHIIGDVHGCYSLLVQLFQKLNYSYEDNMWVHSSAMPVFIGDLINRGPENLAVLQLVMRMEQAGKAVVICGNHEFNFLCWHTPDSKGNYLRPHTANNFNQVKNTLQELKEKSIELPAILAWIRSLPLFIEMPGFNAVHACWDNVQIAKIKHGKFPASFTDNAFLQEAVNPNTESFHLVEQLLKGPEYILPNGIVFKDNDGRTRNKARVSWWNPDRPIQELLLRAPKTKIADDEAFRNQLPRYNDENHLFIGHYCLLDANPQLLNHKIACVDYCGYKANRLTAYKFEGNTLNSDDFIQVIN